MEMEPRSKNDNVDIFEDFSEDEDRNESPDKLEYNDNIEANYEVEDEEILEVDDEKNIEKMKQSIALKESQEIKLKEEASKAVKSSGMSNKMLAKVKEEVLGDVVTESVSVSAANSASASATITSKAKEVKIESKEGNRVSKPVVENTLYKINTKITDGQPRKVVSQAVEIKEEESKKVEVSDVGNFKAKAVVKSTKQESILPKKLNSSAGVKNVLPIDKANPRYTVFEKLIINPPVEMSNEELISMVTKPLLQGTSLCTNLLRKKENALSSYSFVVYLDKNQRFLMSAKKKAGSVNPNYTISIDADNHDRKSKLFVGKVKSNVLGTMFDIWDTGVKAEKATKDTEVRRSLGCVTYKVNLFGLNGPRKMKVYLPAVNPQNYEYSQFKDEKNVKHLLNTNYKTGKFYDSINLMINKPPRWNEKYKAFVLNFDGRVSKGSVKNFQLISERNPDYVLMQFGRANENTFSLDFQYPLSPLQAFAIAITSLDNKLALE